MRLSFLPNALCIARILLVAPCAWAIVVGRYELTLALFGIAAVSDGLDGWLAKTFGWTSRLGKILDPLADKLLLVTVFVTLGILGLAPLWLTLAVVLRDLTIIGGAIAYRVLIGPLEGHPTVVSKLNTLLQLSFVLTVLASVAWGGIPAPLMVALGAATFVTTGVSGLHYVLTYARDARQARRTAAQPAR